MNPLAWLYRRLPWSTEAGQIPAPLRAELDAEGVLLLAEGLRGTMVYRRYREPSEYTRYTKHSTAGSIAITGRRLLVWAQHMKYINLDLRHPLLRQVVVVAERPDLVRFTIDVAWTNRDRSGEMELRLVTDQATRIVHMITASR